MKRIDLYVEEWMEGNGNNSGILDYFDPDYVSNLDNFVLFEDRLQSNIDSNIRIVLLAHHWV